MSEAATDHQEAAQSALRGLIRDVPDFPVPGVLFRDIGPLLGDAEGLQAVTSALAGVVRASGARKVAGIEARGFLLAVPVAVSAGLGVIPIRKAGKLPGPVHRIDYALEYGTATLEMQADALAGGEPVIIVDDVLATGGTARAAAELLRDAGGVPLGLAVLIELASLGGRAHVAPLEVQALLTI